VNATRGGDVLGGVVFGRDEGQRLLACLASLAEASPGVPCVYVDSASRDGSAARVRALGHAVVELDPAQPLSAARARNAGLARLRELVPALELVFFVDGDCRVAPGFVPAARAALERDPELAAVCGRRRELAPDASPYNRVVEVEWSGPAGAADAFGGDVVLRVSALDAVGPYDEALAQGEDPELAFRLRRAGRRILRLGCDMTLHDVALERFSAWARRHARGGYAYAHGAARHWRDPGRYNRRALASILAWGLLLPLALAVLAWPTRGAALLGLGAYALLFARVRSRRIRCGDPRAHATTYAALITLGKPVEAFGALRCARDLVVGRAAVALPYKAPVAERASRAA
jgi:GT2 family glycosyltransferase